MLILRINSIAVGEHIAYIGGFVSALWQLQSWSLISVGLMLARDYRLYAYFISSNEAKRALICPDRSMKSARFEAKGSMRLR